MGQLPPHPPSEPATTRERRAPDAGGSTPPADATLGTLEFDTTASLLAADGSLLADESVVAVWAEPTARNRDSDGDGDAVFYDDATRIPLVAVDGDVVGFGATLVSDEANFQYDTEQFLLNVWDAHLGGSGTVLYDRGHGQFHPLSDFQNVRNYAERNGYAVATTNSPASDLTDADALWVTAPDDPFTDAELQALSAFRSDGGAIFLHDRADYRNFDRTANLNAVAEALSVSFRFNDDQVVDDTNNDGRFYKPTTTAFNPAFDYFAARAGIEIDPETTHDVAVIAVADGDTVKVQFDSGRAESVRVLGVDTPEKAGNEDDERLVEWAGIHDMSYLAAWGQHATDFAVAELMNERVTLGFDAGDSDIFDRYDRLLGYLWYDATGDGTRDTFYNRELVAQGYARVYSSSFGHHDEFVALEAAARADGRNLWAESDPAAATEYRNRDAEALFFPKAMAVTAAGGPLPAERTVVAAESTAVQSPNGGFVYGVPNVPLAGIDESANVALVGGLLVDESYEFAEGYPVDTAGFENFVVLTNLIDHLSDRDGDVVIDGGHGQFDADWALGAEDVAYYRRHLEGFGIELRQANALTAETLAGARALLVTSPRPGLSAADLDAVRSFVESGGAVVLLGGSDAPNAAVENLDAVTAALGADLRLNGGSVTDATNNVDGDETVPTTTVFDRTVPVFSAYRPAAEPGLELAAVHPTGPTLTDEHVRFENVTDESLSLTGWSVRDGADHEYRFPDGFALGPGEAVTLRTGVGDDTDSDLFWGRRAPVWNDDADTVTVFDDGGAEVLRESY